jgi:Matrixin
VPRRSVTWILACVGALTLPGCIYDSQWQQSKTEQKNYAAHLKPAEVGAATRDESLVRRRGTVRACATRAYAAETLGWQTRFDELLRDATTVLAPSLGLSLESRGTTLWSPEHGEAGLSSVIADLPSCEGPDTDWVVALVQSTPKVVADFHVAGRGQTFSPYLAMRAPNDPAELEALSRALPDIDETARQKLYSDRKRHKVLTVFLHEIAHTLGAVHRTAKDTIMSPMYDASEHGFDEPSLALLKDGLAIRLDRANLYGKQRQYLQQNPGGFKESERLEHVTFLERWELAMQGRPPPTSSGPTSGSPPPLPAAPMAAVAFDTMPREDRQTFNEAVALEATNPHDAWTLASPLFEAHPTVRPVQELRCRLAKARHFFPGVVEAHCARLAALGPEATTAAH